MAKAASSVDSTRTDPPTDLRFKSAPAPVTVKFDTVAASKDVAFQSRKSYAINKGTIAATIGKSANLGSGVPVDITPLGYIVLMFVKL